METLLPTGSDPFLFVRKVQKIVPETPFFRSAVVCLPCFATPFFATPEPARYLVKDQHLKGAILWDSSMLLLIFCWIQSVSSAPFPITDIILHKRPAPQSYRNLFGIGPVMHKRLTAASNRQMRIHPVWRMFSRYKTSGVMYSPAFLKEYIPEQEACCGHRGTKQECDALLGGRALWDSFSCYKSLCGSSRLHVRLIHCLLPASVRA